VSEIDEIYFPELVRRIWKQVKKDGAKLATMPEKYGDKLARLISKDNVYKFVCWIGWGGEALLVEMREQAGLKRRVAVKIAWPEFNAPGERVVVHGENPLKYKVTEKNSYFLRFRRGIIHQQQILEACSFENGSIPAIYYVSEKPLYFIMQYVSGTRLDAWVKNTGLAERVRQFEKILKFAYEIHSHTIFHRDLKPNNIIIRRSHPWLIDWTTAKSLDDDDDITLFKFSMGSQDYTAPEVLLDAGSADWRSDIFSLGKILEFMWTCERPTSTGDKLPGPLRLVYRKATHFERSKRYQLSSQFLEAFTEALRLIEIQEKPVYDIAELFKKLRYKGIDISSLAINLYKAIEEMTGEK
jgi:serine/threonine protein kinase